MFRLRMRNSKRSKADNEKRQQALTNLKCWSRDNKLEFNPYKCKVLKITGKNSPLIYAYEMNTTAVSQVEKKRF